MEEANKNLQNLLKECREKNQYYTQKLNEQKAKEKQLNFENLYSKAGLSNKEINSLESYKNTMDNRVEKNVVSTLDSNKDKNSNQKKENYISENFQESYKENQQKKYLYNHANEIYDSHEDEEHEEMKYTEENNEEIENPCDGSNDEDHELSNNDENYMSKEDNEFHDKREAIDSHEEEEEVENVNTEEKEEKKCLIIKIRDIVHFNKYENAIKQSSSNQIKDVKNENSMPNTFFSNQEKIKNNLQTNMPLKITQKNNLPIKDKIQKIDPQDDNNQQNFNKKNNKLNYSGRSYSEEESGNHSPKKPEKLNKYDLSLSDNSLSASSDKIKSKQKAVVNKNLNRSTDSEEEQENSKKENQHGIRNLSGKPKLTIHQKIGAVPNKTVQKDTGINNLSKAKGTHHTAYTFSTIVKMKKEEKPNKSSVFKDKVLGKKYNGKSDRVAIYQYLKNEWNKTPILKKNTTNNSNVIKEETKEKNKNNTEQKLKNIRRPLSYYKKF